MYRFSLFAVLLLGVALSNGSFAQSPANTETIEKWNSELREKIRRLEAEKADAELRRRKHRVQAERENAKLDERVRQLQSERSSQQSLAPQAGTPQPQRAPHGSLDISFGSAGRGSSMGATNHSPVNILRRLLQSDRVAGQQGPASPAVAPRSDVPIVIGTVDFNSFPEGAIAQTSLGAGCETPCSVEISANGPFTVTFTQRGYAPTTVSVQIEPAQQGVSDPKFSPNPVYVQLTPMGKQ